MALAALHNVDLGYVLGVLIVAGCLIGAIVTGLRGAWIPVLCLLGAALVAAYIFL